jgi:hypothetical protein
MEEQSQQQTRSPQISQRAGGVVPSLGHELEAEARKRDKPRRKSKPFVFVWRKLARTPPQPLPRPQNQSIAPTVVSGQQAPSPTTVSNLGAVNPRIPTVSPAHEATAQSVLSPEQDHELGRVSVSDAIDVHKADVYSPELERWVSSCIRDFLGNNAKGKVTFGTFLEPYGKDGLENAKFGKRSYLAICLHSAVGERLKRNLQREMDDALESRHDAERFEIRVSIAHNLKLKGSLGDDMDQLIDSQSMIHVAFSSSPNTLCAANITLVTDHRTIVPYSRIWTCGGLISVRDRIYALTVSHPLQPQDDMEEEAKLSDQHPGQNLRGHIWSSMGRVFRNSSEVSHLSGYPNEPDSDWMLVEVQKAMQLPNVASSVKQQSGIHYISDRSPSFEDSTGKVSCVLLTSRGPESGMAVSGFTYLVFGNKRFRTMQVLINQPLGTSLDLMK